MKKDRLDSFSVPTSEREREADRLYIYLSEVETEVNSDFSALCAEKISTQKYFFKYLINLILCFKTLGMIKGRLDSFSVPTSERERGR